MKEFIENTMENVKEFFENVNESYTNANLELSHWLMTTRFGFTVLYTVYAILETGLMFMSRAFNHKAKKRFWKGYWKLSEYNYALGTIIYTIQAIRSLVIELTNKD